MNVSDTATQNGPVSRRGTPYGLSVWLRTFTGRDALKVSDQRKRAVVNRGFCGLLRRVLTLTLRGVRGVET